MQHVSKEVGETHQIQLPGSAGDPSNGQFAWLKLTRTPPNEPTVDPASLVVTGVRGASFRTRIGWREARIWRFRERTSILTREQSR